MPHFSRDWFSRHIAVWSRLFSNLRDKPTTALELGSYEGRSAVWLLDNVLTHPESKIICVDPFIQGTGDLWNVKGIEARLRANLEPYGNKATFHKLTSADYFRTNWQDIDLCYIDAHHTPPFVLSDMVQTWARLRRDGCMVVDDYLWLASKKTPKPAVDGFYNCFHEELDILEWGYQFACRKIV